ncbi:hypothetical protein U1Q18_047350 [Sarracenia purpurea var. burkii]
MEATRSNRWRRRDRTDGGDTIEPEPPSSEELIHDGSAQGKGGDAGVAKVRAAGQRSRRRRSRVRHREGRGEDSTCWIWNSPASIRRQREDGGGEASGEGGEGG